VAGDEMDTTDDADRAAPAERSLSGSKKGEVRAEAGEVAEQPAKAPAAPKKAIKSARDLFIEEVGARSDRVEPTLKAQLLGTIVVEVSGNKGRYLIDGRGDTLKVSEFQETPQLRKSEQDPPTTIDCVVRLSEPHLFQVRSGELNPQLAMLSEKIRVEGRIGLAVYLFNLIAPRDRSRA
jgi:SCP-2 sterol transfer family